jgi:hypothetical protein
MEFEKWLEWFPSVAELAALHERCTRKHPPLEGFSDPQQLINFLYSSEPADFKRQDEILYLLISESLSSEDNTILNMYLFILLYSFLEKSLSYWLKQFKKFQTRNEIRNQVSAESLWNEIWIAFHRALKDFNLNERHDKIGIYFQGKVKDHLEKYYRKKTKEWQTELPYNEEFQGDQKPTIPTKNKRQQTRKKGETFSEEEIMAMEPIFQNLIADKLIDSDDMMLIIENKLRKKSVSKIAQELNKSPIALKKRIWRIRKILIPVLHEIVSKMSPF